MGRGMVQVDAGLLPWVAGHREEVAVNGEPEQVHCL